MTEIDVSRWTNVAQPRLGAVALAASDEFFAAKERLIDPRPPVFHPELFDEHGKWMDGWETRRKRVAGHDWCVVALGRPARVHAVDIDTSYFTGNYPLAASLDACREGDPLDPTTPWTTILPATELQGNSHHLLPVAEHGPWSALRLNIYPDGGVARLRVYGAFAPDPRELASGEELELSGALLGGQVVAWSDNHYGGLGAVLFPDRGRDMGDGWETRRRRVPGNEWLVVRLGHPGTLRRIVVDTLHNKGNYPDRVLIQAACVPDVPDVAIATSSMFWPVLLPEQPLGPDQVHEFRDLADLGVVTHARVNIIPDGGVSRLRLFGTPER